METGKVACGEVPFPAVAWSTGGPAQASKPWRAERTRWEVRGLHSFPSGGHKAGGQPFSCCLKPRIWLVWNSPTVWLEGHWLLLFYVYCYLLQTALFTRTLQMRGPACDFKTSGFPLHASHSDSSLPLLVPLYHNAVSQK